MNTNETPNLCGLKREDFQTTINGKKTDLYVIMSLNDVGIVAVFVWYHNSYESTSIVGDSHFVA